MRLEGVWIRAAARILALAMTTGNEIGGRKMLALGPVDGGKRDWIRGLRERVTDGDHRDERRPQRQLNDVQLRLRNSHGANSSMPMLSISRRHQE